MATKTSPDKPVMDFRTALYALGPWTILRLPKEASAQLPSRGQTMVEITLNGIHLKTPLEPDGNFSHWVRIDDKTAEKAHIRAGDPVSVSIRPINEWVEPEVPADLQKALDSDPATLQLWSQITPLSRWEWIRWIRSTGRQETRQKRISVAMSKMKAGERRPCCWNRNLCTEPSVSKNGVLLEPAA